MEEVYEPHLAALFPAVSSEAIRKVIGLITAENTENDFDENLQIMANVLMEATAEENEVFHDQAVGFGDNLTSAVTSNFDQLSKLFPDASTEFLYNLCLVKANLSLDELIENVLSNGYDLKHMDPRQTFKKLMDIIPDADPDYLKDKSNELNTETLLNEFIQMSFESNNYPTREQYMKKQKESENIEKYTTYFDIEEFLENFPLPLEHFSNPNRVHALAANEDNGDDEDYALTFLYNQHLYLRKKDIAKLFAKCKKNVITTCDKLERLPKSFLMPRRKITETDTRNVTLVQEIAYIKNRKAIRTLFKMCDENYRRAKEEAKQKNLLQTCQCCFDEELIPEECYFCKNRCIFCKQCVKQGAETAIGEGKLEFPCLADCESEFSFPTLQMVLDSVAFTRMAHRKQMEEVKNANIDGLETCPFCEFATIPASGDQIFKCLNNECMKESCRKCRHISHIPKRCEEIEYDEDVKIRTYIENKMTEALLRECWKCKKTFIKESGCNKMTCTCGATLCYVCRQPVKDYTHFGESGKCPLWTNDLKKFHENAVKRGAEVAKVDLGIDTNPAKLKMDPTKDIEKFF